jgi:small-conductance mechanosensitive channel
MEKYEGINKRRGKEESATSVIGRIDELTVYMDSVNQLVIGKSNYVLKLLDKATDIDVRVEDMITSIDEMIIEKEGKIFERDQPSIFSMDFDDSNSWNIKGPLLMFYHTEIKQLDRYMMKHIPNFIFQMVLSFFLVLGFITIKKRLKNSKIENASDYKKRLILIFTRPISAAILLGLFASVLIFENRPPIFREALVILAIVPLIIILLSIGKEKYKKYVYLFGILFLIRQMYYVFPPGNILHRFSLLSIALIEITVIILLLRQFISDPVKKKLRQSLILGFLYLHLGFAIAGFTGVIIGSNMLAEVTLNVFIVNTFAGLLLTVSAIIINGLVELAIDSKTLQKINVFRINGPYLKKKLTDLINLGAFIYWILIMMRTINIDRLVIDGLTSFFTKELSIGSTSFTLGGIFIFFFVIWLSTVISKVIRAILEEDVLNKFSLAKGVPRTISVMIGYTLVTLGVFLAVSAAGIPMTSLTLIIGAFGVGIGFGLQNIFNNLVSGLILLFERPIQINDTIEVGTLIGKVKSMGIRSSHVRTFDGAEVIVPNGNLISNEVVNWTLSDQQRRIEVIAGVAYGTDPHLVRKLFLEELGKHPDIIKDPAPDVFFQNMGESSLDFRLLFWTSNFSDWLRIRSEIVFKVHDILKENNIEIPFPQRDLHIRSMDKSIEFKK